MYFCFVLRLHDSLPFKFSTYNSPVAEGATDVVHANTDFDVFDFFELLRVSPSCKQDYLIIYTSGFQCFFVCFFLGLKLV